MRPQLYCDIDSTVNDHWNRIRRNAINGVIQPSAFTLSEVMRDMPLPDAARVLNRFAQDWDVHFLTSRAWDADGLVTEAWLKEHGFQSKSVTIVQSHQAKADFLLRNRCELYIDDFTVGQEYPEVTLLGSLIAAMPVPYEVLPSFYPRAWGKLEDKYFHALPNGELFWQFMVRNMEWWRVNRDHESRTRQRYYDNFLNAVQFNPRSVQGKVVGEIGAGPHGGIIHGLRGVSRRYYIDLLANAQRVLRHVEWHPSDMFIDAPAEAVTLPDKTLDVLLSFNAMDHGWDIRAALAEAMRISRECYLAFDCKADTAPQHDRLDHYQMVRFEEVCAHINALRSAGVIQSCQMGDLRTLTPNFHFEHNWGFPVFYCHTIQ